MALGDIGTYNSGYNNTLSAVSGDEFAWNNGGVLTILISGGPVNLDKRLVHWVEIE